MIRRYLSLSLAVLAGTGLSLSSAYTAHAGVANVTEGTGTDSAQVIFNFPDGFVADYTANFNSTTGTIDGYDLTEIAALDPNLTLQFTNYGTAQVPNEFLNNATYFGGGTSVGYSYNSVSAPDNYWHEYLNDGAGYVFGNGASEDTITNGGAIGWVYGSDNLPTVPEPASLSILAGGSVLLLGRRRRVAAGAA